MSVPHHVPSRTDSASVISARKISLLQVFFVLAFAWFLSAQSVQATTIGYWRFEDSPGFLTDSGPNNLTLTNNNSVVHTTLPGTGAGSDFDNPIPQTLQSNSKAANIPSNGSLSVADNALFSPLTAFTAEAYVNLDSFVNSNFSSVMGQWNASGNQRSWLLMVNNGFASAGQNELFLFGTSTGSSPVAITSGLTVPTGDDVYVGFSFDASKSGTGNGGATFYVQNLTTGGLLQSSTVDHNLSSLFDSTAFLGIGNHEGANNSWIGLIDEARLSSGELSVSELLVTALPPVPEPSSMFLLIGVLGLAARRRRARRWTSKSGQLS